MRNGFSFGFNDTISLSDKQQSPARLQHNPDGTITVRVGSGAGRRSCSATTIRRRTSCAPTSSGSCRASPASETALKAIGLHRQRLEPRRHLERRDRRALLGRPSTTATAAAPRPTGADRLARLRRARGHRRRHGQRLQRRPATSSSTPRPSRARSSAASVSNRAAATCGLLHQHAGPVDLARHPPAAEPASSSCASTCSTR